jgi:hypothetical protein
MSDPRDELAALIEAAIFGVAHEPHAVRSGYRGADAVLAAGYRKPKPLTVTPPHDIDVEHAPYCTVCGKDIHWGEDTDEWEHIS